MLRISFLVDVQFFSVLVRLMPELCSQVATSYRIYQRLVLSGMFITNAAEPGNSDVVCSGNAVVGTGRLPVYFQHQSCPDHGRDAHDEGNYANV